MQYRKFGEKRHETSAKSLQLLPSVKVLWQLRERLRYRYYSLLIEQS